MNETDWSTEGIVARPERDFAASTAKPYHLVPARYSEGLAVRTPTAWSQNAPARSFPRYCPR